MRSNGSRYGALHFGPRQCFRNAARMREPHRSGLSGRSLSSDSRVLHGPRLLRIVTAVHQGVSPSLAVVIATRQLSRIARLAARTVVSRCTVGGAGLDAIGAVNAGMSLASESGSPSRSSFGIESRTRRS